jgi:hypothetical protein
MVCNIALMLQCALAGQDSFTHLQAVESAVAETDSSSLPFFAQPGAHLQVAQVAMKPLR